MAISKLKAIEFASRLAAGGADPATFDWFQTGFSAWVRGGGDMPLERHLQLPRTPNQWRLLKRNVWIKKAAKLFDAPSDWRVACELSEAVKTFVSRGPWLAWRDLSQPPADASQLRAALFHIAKTNKGSSLVPEQFYRVLRRDSQ